MKSQSGGFVCSPPLNLTGNDIRCVLAIAYVSFVFQGKEYNRWRGVAYCHEK